MGLMQLLDSIGGLAGMSRTEVVATGGAAFGFLGGLILAVAASAELAAHRLAISALQLEVMSHHQALLDPKSDLYAVSGTDKHMEKGIKVGQNRTRFGIACLGLSLLMTVGAFFVG